VQSYLLKKINGFSKFTFSAVEELDIAVLETSVFWAGKDTKHKRYNNRSNYLIIKNYAKLHLQNTGCNT